MRGRGSSPRLWPSSSASARLPQALGQRPALVAALAVVAVDLTVYAKGAVETVPVESAQTLRMWLGTPDGGRAWSACDNRVGAAELSIHGRAALRGLGWRLSPRLRRVVRVARNRRQAVRHDRQDTHPARPAEFRKRDERHRLRAARRRVAHADVARRSGARLREHGSVAARRLDVRGTGAVARSDCRDAAARALRVWPPRRRRWFDRSRPLGANDERRPTPRAGASLPALRRRADRRRHLAIRPRRRVGPQRRRADSRSRMSRIRTASTAAQASSCHRPRQNPETHASLNFSFVQVNAIERLRSISLPSISRTDI